MRGQYVRIIHPVGTYAPVAPESSATLGDQAGCTATQVRLGAGALTGNDAYKGWGFMITSGTSSQFRLVTGYNGTTKLATLDRNLDAPLPSAVSKIDFYKPDNVPFIGLQGRAVLNVAEIEVYPDWASPDSGTNLVKSGVATQTGSGLGGDGKPYPAINAIDGDYANFSLTGYDGSGPVWLMVDLKKEADIGIIRVIPRRGVQTRMHGFQFEILDSSSKVVYSSNPIATAMNAYEVFPPAKDVLGTLSATGGSYFTQFTPFSACSAPCGSGTRKRIRGMIPNTDGSVISTNPADLVQIEPCNTHACPVFSAWSDYGACTDNKQTRTRTLISGLAGPGDILTESATCTSTMPTVFSDWGLYGDCSNGKKSRNRTVVSGSNWTAADLREEADCTASTAPAAVPIPTPIPNETVTTTNASDNRMQFLEDNKLPISIVGAVIMLILICCIYKCCK